MASSELRDMYEVYNRENWVSNPGRSACSVTTYHYGKLIMMESERESESVCII